MDEHILTIESVQVNGTSGEGKIYGEITIEFHGLETVYHRTVSDPETKLAGDFLSLTGPSTAAHTDWWTLYVSLYDGDDGHDIAVGSITHHMVMECRTIYDKPMYEVVEGRFGSVTVRYNVMSRAAKSRVAVESRAGKEARVFGTVTARQFLGGGGWSTALTLFGRSAGEGVAVGPGREVPMDRSVVGVLRGSYVVVDVDLRVTGDGGGGHVTVARGSVKFGGGGGTGRKVERVNGSEGRHVQVTMCYI